MMIKLSHVGRGVFIVNINADGIRIGPSNKTVNQAGPSSAASSQSGSPHALHVSAGFK